ncbi:hypothetical protein KFK09_028822 [Dendrobium nobile]|uniref:RRM domain-containing protein n=1 Tax=Dendrobium nobile TaxID=94219 RepID=A0A8T3A437_DENNO|nr:hypothetical protein KFK09_028822 [Dendrobium nobile]
MAVVENTDGSDLSSSREVDAVGAKEEEIDYLGEARITVPLMRSHHDSSFTDFQRKVFKPPMAQQRSGKAAAPTPQLPNGVSRGNDEDGFKQDMRDLEELLSKLNPMAAEFVPPSHINHASKGFGDGGSFFSNNVGLHDLYPNSGYPNGGYLNAVNTNGGRRGKNGYSQGKRRMNNRTSMAQREDTIRRTVYVSDIDHQGARASLSLSGTMLGFYPVRVLPSKTAIAPVDPKYLPRSEDEREMCTRTIYCTNIDSKITQAEVKLFFETVCGPVYRLRLLGDYHNATRIAFVEFARAESAIAALNCSGAVLGSFQLRVSPSKTPVRPRATRSPMS